MGRKPLSVEQHKANGSYQKNPQRENKSAPTALYGTPDMPDTVRLDPVACEKWEHLTGMLSQMNVLALTDHDLLARYCLAWSQFLQVHRELQVTGHVVTTDKGSLIRSPASTAFCAVNDSLHKMSSELGLSPSSRGKLHANPEASDNDPFAQWLQKRGGLN